LQVKKSRKKLIPKIKTKGYFFLILWPTFLRLLQIKGQENTGHEQASKNKHRLLKNIQAKDVR